MSYKGRLLLFARGFAPMNQVAEVYVYKEKNYIFSWCGVCILGAYTYAVRKRGLDAPLSDLVHAVLGGDGASLLESRKRVAH